MNTTDRKLFDVFVMYLRMVLKDRYGATHTLPLNQVKKNMVVIHDALDAYSATKEEVK